MTLGLVGSKIGEGSARRSRGSAPVAVRVQAAGVIIITRALPTEQGPISRVLDPDTLAGVNDPRPATPPRGGSYEVPTHCLAV
jgi:hypothetical protein